MLAVVTNLPGWRVASPESDLEKAPDADWPLYPTTLPVLPVMFGVRTYRTSQGIFVSQTLATTQAIQAFFHRLSVAVPGAAVPLDMRTLGIVHIFPLELLTAPMVRHLSFNQPRFA